MQISNRLLKVLKYLEENNITCIKDISLNLNISERVVRYDINTLNYLFNLNNISKIKKGSRGKLIFDKKFIGSLKLEELYKMKKTSKLERVELLKAKLLIEGKLNLTALTSELNVSRTSIRKDLEEVIGELKRNNIKFKNNQLAKNTEYEIRNILFELYSEKIKFFLLEGEEVEKSLLDVYLFKYLNKLSIHKLKGAIKKFVNKNEKQKQYMEIFLYIVIAFLRISNNYYIKKSNQKNNIISDDSEELQLFFSEIEESLKINLKELEKEEFKKFLIGVFNPNYNKFVTKHWLEIILIVKKIIKQIEDTSNVNLNEDDFLLDDLLEHLKSTIIRLKYKGKIEHNIYTEVIGPYPELFISFKKMLNPLEKVLDLDLPSSEVTLIIVHFLAALERNNERKTKRILMVCGGGFGTSSLIAKKISDLYHVEIVKNINYTEFKEYDFKNIDIVITTLNIKNSENQFIPLIRVSPLLTPRDKENLNNYLLKKNYNEGKFYEILDIINKNADIKDKDELIKDLETSLDVKINCKKKELFQYKLSDWINSDQIKIIKNLSTWEEAIEKSGEILLKNNYIEANYISKILETTNEVGAYYLLPNGIAIPHGEVGNFIKDSSVSMLIVKNGVYFPNKPKTNILFLLAAKGTKDHIKTIDNILTLSKNQKMVKRIIKAETEEEVYQILKLIK